MDRNQENYNPIYHEYQKDTKPIGHACLIYSDPQEQYEVLCRLLKECIKNKELCIYITDGSKESPIHNILNGKDLELKQAKQIGAIQVHSSNEMTSASKTFDISKFDQFVTALKNNLDTTNFKTLKIISENAWICDDTVMVVHREYQINEIVDRLKISMICQYDFNQYEPKVMKSVIGTHPIVIFDGIVSKNPFYMEPENDKSPDRDKLEVLQLLKNINQFEKTEKELINLAVEYRNIIDGFTGLIFYKNLEDQFVWVNDNYVKAIGISRETLLNNKISELFPKGDNENYIKDDEEVISTGIPKRNIIERVTSAEGEKWVSTDKIPMFDRNGEVVGIFGFAFDITEEVRLQKALQKSEELYHSVYDNSPLAFGIWDNDFRFVDWNKRAEELFGWSKEEVLGKRFVDLLIPENIRASIKEVASNLLLEGLAKITQNENITKDGKILFFEWHNTLLHDNEGNLVGAISLGLDKTESRKIEKERKEEELILRQAKIDAEAANYAKGQFLANMSHEIRTPMNGFMGILQLLQMTELNEEQNDLINVAKTSSDSLLKILNDIVDYSKIEAQMIELESISFHLNELIAELKKLFTPVAINKGISLNAIIDDKVPNQLRGDHFKLRQILSNLIGNAIKFTSKGQISIHVKNVKELENNKVRLEFSIQDTGIGIHTDKLDMLFKRFSQVESSTTRKYGGTGLGLAISKGLVEKMDGEIWITSKEGFGTTCYFTCVLDKNSIEDGKHLLANDSVSNLKDLEHIRILVAEDDEISRMVIAGLGKHKGWEVIFTENGEEVIQLNNEQYFDIIFMDIHMPILDGYEATMAIRQLEQQNHKRHIPIVAMTAFALKGDKEKCIEIGMDDYLSKPIDLNLFFEAVERLKNK